MHQLLESDVGYNIFMAAIIYHNNGRQILFGDRKRCQVNLGPVFFKIIERKFLADNNLQGKFKRPKNLDIVICNSSPARQYTEKILDYLGIDDYIVLGKHLKQWKHIYKIQLILDYIKSNRQPDYILHLDAPDVLVVNDLQLAVDRFCSDFSCDLLFGAEKNSAPGSRTAGGITIEEKRFIERIEQFEKAKYGPLFPHLNAGCFIGRKDFLLGLLSETLSNSKFLKASSIMHHGDYLFNDDQLIFREVHRDYYPRIQIDHTCRIFQNMYIIKKTELSTEYIIPRGLKLFTEYCRYFIPLLFHEAIKRFRKSFFRVFPLK